jgi:hypothetical protein
MDCTGQLAMADPSRPQSPPQRRCFTSRPQPLKPSSERQLRSKGNPPTSSHNRTCN